MSVLNRLKIVFAIGLVGSGAVSAATVAYFYTYDPAGRLTTQLNVPNGICTAYAYDASGNRTAQTTTIGGNPVSSLWGTGTWGCALWSP